MAVSGSGFSVLSGSVSFGDSLASSAHPGMKVAVSGVVLAFCVGCGSGGLFSAVRGGEWCTGEVSG